MTNLILIIVLGVLQGVAEFLPVSSSGHLVVAAALLERFTDRQLPDFVELNIVLHAGTLLSILVVYWREFWRMLLVDRRVLARVIVGTIPAVAVGLPLHEIPAAKELLGSPLLAGCMLPVTGAMLIWASRRPQGEFDYASLSYGRVLTIGVMQAVAILPGISRSGATIAAGLGVGLERRAAATFSFLLAVPVIAGAVVLEGRKLLSEPTPNANLAALAIGAAVAFVVGVLSLKLLINWLQRGRLHWFAYWCIPVGIAVIVWQLWGAGQGSGM